MLKIINLFGADETGNDIDTDRAEFAAEAARFNCKLAYIITGFQASYDICFEGSESDLRRLFSHYGEEFRPD